MKVNDVERIPIPINRDQRGFSSKTFSNTIIQGTEFQINELFVSTTLKNVIRGIHVQTAPFLQKKLLYLVKGHILDVIVDLRRESSTWGQYQVFDIEQDSGYLLYIPQGCAHGFKAIGEENIIMYAIEGTYSQACDTGIRWDSFGLDWEIQHPIISARDRALPSMEEFAQIKEEIE